LPAGEIARRIAVPHNTMSTHLAILTREFPQHSPVA
jgi:ArsR family transcriptional regulator, arsenate/arsenite/antimonite-responsive transcriptional repressor